jgi:hypothetical protein
VLALQPQAKLSALCLQKQQVYGYQKS